MTIEAMKLALDALETCAVIIDGEWGKCRRLMEMRETGNYTRETTKAITVLHQAIAKAERGTA